MSEANDEMKGVRFNDTVKEYSSRQHRNYHHNYVVIIIQTY